MGRKKNQAIEEHVIQYLQGQWCTVIQILNIKEEMSVYRNYIYNDKFRIYMMINYIYIVAMDWHFLYFFKWNTNSCRDTWNPFLLIRTVQLVMLKFFLNKMTFTIDWMFK
jgi:hypothetical protein